MLPNFSDESDHRASSYCFRLRCWQDYAVNNALSHYRGLPYVALPLEEYGVERGCDAGASLQDGCHGARTSSSTVIHIYTTSGPVYAGSTDTLRISVANPDPVDIAAGFDLDVDTPAMLDTIPGMNTFPERCHSNMKRTTLHT